MFSDWETLVGEVVRSFGLELQDTKEAVAARVHKMTFVFKVERSADIHYIRQSEARLLMRGYSLHCA